jgi:hypothetical protein
MTEEIRMTNDETRNKSELRSAKGLSIFELFSNFVIRHPNLDQALSFATAPANGHRH